MWSILNPLLVDIEEFGDNWTNMHQVKNKKFNVSKLLHHEIRRQDVMIPKNNYKL